ncbi:hypothetical protein KAOT1_00450 [Kordia algicida OT-1]|uniref:Uncharacterized protein n=1 Tax=Kordia algicida OT-1 TaxID=391587 RepID=A9E9S5_9FLAO|nr:hypothetical protein KAOT1_00450 [Kordia algicida OT-1]
MVSETQFLVGIFVMEVIILLVIVRYFYVKNKRRKKIKNKVDEEIEKELTNKDRKYP